MDHAARHSAGADVRTRPLANHHHELVTGGLDRLDGVPQERAPLERRGELVGAEPRGGPTCQDDPGGACFALHRHSLPRPTTHFAGGIGLRAPGGGATAPHGNSRCRC
jgi:hypothetical protein